MEEGGESRTGGLCFLLLSRHSSPISLLLLGGCCWLSCGCVGRCCAVRATSRRRSSHTTVSLRKASPVSATIWKDVGIKSLRKCNAMQCVYTEMLLISDDYPTLPRTIRQQLPFPSPFTLGGSMDPYTGSDHSHHVIPCLIVRDAEG